MNTSTTSPFSSVDSSGTSRPFTRAPMQRCPTSVWIAYAKSTGDEPIGSAITSPFGVNTYTSDWLISNRSESRNSDGSDVSRCQSTSCRTHGMSFGLADSPWSAGTARGSGAVAAGSSLYFQCAAMPYSALRCIANDRICSSTGLPCGPITVVCSDWYMLNFGIAM